MLYRPDRILLVGFAIYLALYLVAPIQPLVVLSAASIGYIALCSATFVLGVMMSRRVGWRQPQRSVPRAMIRGMTLRLFDLFVVIGLFGNALRLLDKYVLRGVGGASALDARTILTETPTTALGLIGAVAYPFGFLPLLIYLGSRHMPALRLRLVLAFLLLLIPMLDALALFSRSYMLTTVAMTYFALCLTRYSGRAAPLRLIVPLLAMLVLLITVSAVAFIWRLDAMQFDPIDSVFMSAYAYTVIPDAWAMEVMDEGGVGGSALLATMPLIQYFIHSIYEFELLWQFDQGQFAFGTLHFGPYFKLLGMIGIQVEFEDASLFPRVGVFTSFFGPLWVDFGWFGPIVTAGFGMMSGFLAKGIRRGDLGALPLYAYFCVIILFAPVVNFAITAQGMYVINAFFLFWAMTRRLSRLVPHEEVAG
jgi:hypothetical protein